MPNKPPTVFLCYRCICLPSSVHSLRATNVFILFTMYVFSMHSLCTPTVFILFIAVYVFRVAHRATALAGCKASRRLGKQIRGLSRFLSNFHSTSGFCLSPPIGTPQMNPTLFNDVRFSQYVPLVSVTTHSTTLPYNHPH